MRVRMSVVAGIAACATLALAQDSLETAPVNPFTDATKGDWAAYAETNKDPDLGTSKAFRRYIIETIADDEVTWFENFKVAGEAKAGDNAAPMQFSKKAGFTYKILLSAFPPAKIEEAKVSDEEKTIGDKKFKCKKVIFKVTEGTTVTTGTIWMSSDVKARGIVAFEKTWGKSSFSEELIGYGTAGGKTWGKTIDEAK
jgi:hypothetical protein